MSIIDSLIFDRTASDVERWRVLRKKGYASMTAAEKAEWDAGMKGAYNASDFNRVESAVEYLAGRLNASGYLVEVRTKTNWTYADIPTPDDLARYISNVRTIRDALAVLSTTPSAPADAERLPWNEANDIERILLDVDALIGSLQAIYLRSLQPLLYSGFAVYMPEQAIALYVQEADLPVYTADGSAVYTSDGLQVFVKYVLPVYTSEEKKVYLTG